MKKNDIVYLDNNINKYLDFLKYEKKLSINTYNAYKNDLSKFYIFFNQNNEKIATELLSHEKIKSFFYSLNLSNKSKAHYLTVIRSYYNFLIKENVIANNPVESIKMPSIEKKLPKYLTVEDIDKLLNIKLIKPNDYRNKAMLELLYASGMRISELVQLKLSQIDFSESLVRVTGKGKKDRVIPLNDVSIYFLSEYIQNYRQFLLKTKDSEYVFINGFGSRISRQGFFKILKKLCLESGIEQEVSPHTLRHSFATHLLNNGADLRIIQELLGHENIVTTEIYAHLQNKKIKDDYNNHPRAKIN